MNLGLLGIKIARPGAPAILKEHTSLPNLALLGKSEPKS
jgi:hypothetical protein